MTVRRAISIGSLAAWGLLACGARPAEILPSMGLPVLAEAPPDFPRMKLADGTITENDRCPVAKRKLSVHFPPVYVNGKPIGFC